MHHDLQMSTRGEKTSVGTGRKYAKLQKVQHRAFEDKPILSYKEHRKKHENHFISAALFSTPLRYNSTPLSHQIPFVHLFVGWLFTGMAAFISTVQIKVLQ